MTVLVMEPLVVTGFRTRAVAGPDAGRGRPARSPAPGATLTNRAAGRLRDAATAQSDAGDARFGGFGYVRTAQDAADVAAAALRAEQSGVAPPAPSDDARSSGTAGARASASAGAGAQQPLPAASAGTPDSTSTSTSTDSATTDTTASTPTVGATEPHATAPGAPGPASPGTTPDATATPPAPTGLQTPEDIVSATRAAASALPTPEVPPTNLADAMRPIITTSTALTAVGRGGGGGRPVPVRPVDPIEIDPVPQATAALSLALNARLPELHLPALTARPDGVLPAMAAVRGVAAEELLTEVPVTDPAPAATDVNAAETRRASTASRAPPPDPDATPAEVPVNPPVLLDVRAPPEPPLPAAQVELETAQITRVLAIITQGVAEKAADVVRRVREQAFPPQRLEDHFTSITNPWIDEVHTLLDAKVAELMTAANVSRQALDAAVTARQAEVAARRAHEATADELELRRTVATRDLAAERANAAALARQRREQAQLVARLRSALHRRDRALVDELVTRRLGYIDDDVGTGTVAVDAAKARRLDLIGRYETAYQDAYRLANSDFQHPAGRGEPRAPPANPDGSLWIDGVRDRLTTDMTALRTQTGTDADTLAAGVRTAGLAARAAVQSWRDSRFPRTPAPDAAARAAADADALDTRITAARADAARAGVRDDLLRDVRLASAAYLQAQDDRNQVCGDRMRHLTDEQMAYMRTYLGRGDPTDPMSAVANVLVGRVSEQFATAHLATLRQQVLDMYPGNPAETDQLAIAYFPDGPGGLHGRVSKLWRAFDGPGTDEDAVIEALSGLDEPQTKLLRVAYQQAYTETLLSRIDSEMSGSDYTRAAGLAIGSREMYARGEIAASDGIFSNDSARALQAIRDLPPGTAAGVVADPDTRAHLTTVLGGARFVEGRGALNDERGENELQLLVLINEGTAPPSTSASGADTAPAPAGVPGSPLAPRLRDLQARADAIELDRIIRRGTGSDAPSLDALFDRIRASVSSDPRTANWSAQDIDDEVRNRARAMEIAYEREYGSELPGGGVSALRTAIARYQYGSTHDLTLTMLDVNRADERAVRLQRTTEGLYTSDSELNTELERTYRDARAEVQRNAGYRERIRVLSEQLMARDHIGTDAESGRERTPSPRERDAYEREATDALARELARTWMTDVEGAFGQRYASRWGGDPATALHAMVVSETQFDGEREALDRLKNGGGLTEAQAIEHGVAGWGMDRDRVVGSLEGRTVQQIARISAEYQTNTGEDMVTRLRSESGGWNASTPDVRLERDGFDIREALRGVPRTPDEERDAAGRRFAYERDVYFRDNPAEREYAVGHELADLQREYDRVARRTQQYHDAVAAGDTRRMQMLDAAVRASHDSMRVAAANYRTAVDAYVDRTTQIVSIAAAVLAAVVVTVVTGGTAGPVVVGLIASLAGTAAGIANKQAILGSAYSSTALQTDLIVGAVDAVVTVLTARLGNVLLRLPKATGATPAALRASMRAIEAQRLARPLLQRAAAFAAEQVAQSVPSAVTGALLSRDTWRGDPLRNVLTTAGTAAAVGIGVGTAMHGLTHFGPKLLGAAADTARMLRGGTGSAIAEDAVVLGSTRRALAAGGEAAERAGGSTGGPLERFLARREYLARFPGSTEFDFNAALAEGAVRSRQAASGIKALETEMMGHLLSGVSGPDAELVRQTRIVMLSDAEFAARTGSESNGMAATLVINGDPVVVVREGAPLSALREEGLHVQQFFDPAHVERLRLLDEGRMARWGELGLAERMGAWHAKIDLELEVQQRLIGQLEAELDAPGLAPERALALSDQLDDVRAAAETLTHRRGVLAGLGADDLGRMRAGELEPPSFLADEPRLFGKTRAPLADLDLPTSTLEELPSGGYREVGQEFTSGGVRRRFVRVLAADGTVLHTALEKRVGGQWRTSGRTGRVRGGIAEIAMRMERSAGLGVHGEVTRVAFDAQRGSGSGFDDVIFSFRNRPDGSVIATMSITELKDYFDNYVGSWSAVADNFDKNLAEVERRLNQLLAGGESSLARAGMSEAQVRAALRTIAERGGAAEGGIHIELRIGEFTQVGPDAVSSVTRAANSTPGSDVRVTLARRPIGADAVAEAARFWDTIEGYRVLGAKDPRNVLFKSLADSPQGMTPESIQLADLVLASQGAGVIGERVRWAPDHTHLLDSRGTFAVSMVDPEALHSRGDFGVQARLLVDQLAAQEKLGGPGSHRLLVDAGALSSAEAAELRRAVRSVAQGSAMANRLDGLLFVAPDGTISTP